jgi:hypothetical protein
MVMPKSMRGCDRAGCQRKHYCKGFCESHYHAARRGGGTQEAKQVRERENLWLFVKSELGLN